jgi:hypothetical protein
MLYISLCFIGSIHMHLCRIDKFETIPFPNRNASACYYQYNKHFKKEGAVRQRAAHAVAWSQDEIDLLKAKTKHFNGGHAPVKDFDEIAESFANRTAGACQTYYHVNLKKKGGAKRGAVMPSDDNDSSKEEDENEDAAVAVSRPSDMVQTCTTSSVDFAEEMWV